MTAQAEVVIPPAPALFQMGQAPTVTSRPRPVDAGSGALVAPSGPVQRIPAPEPAEGRGARVEHLMRGQTLQSQTGYTIGFSEMAIKTGHIPLAGVKCPEKQA